MTQNSKQIFIFDKEPTFAELWDKCVYGFLYNIDEYMQDIEELFAKLGVTKQSDIIDVSTGGGFPSLDLMKAGYHIDCTDGFQDEVDLFNKKSKSFGLETRCINVRWENLQNTFQKNTFDFLFCRGNSYIYAGGGWNEMIEIEQDKSLSNYRQTLSIFYDLIKPNGWIYIDKFKDSETSHKEKVCEIKVGNNPNEDLIFWTQRFPEKRIRQASMIRKNESGERGVPNITYDLSASELGKMFEEVGFKNVQKIELGSEKHFDIWIAQK